MRDSRDQRQLTELRRQAERRLIQVIERAAPIFNRESVAALAHELQVHHIELEMQCQELLLAQSRLEESETAYRELYESIPVGSVTVDREGRINHMNRAGRTLLKLDPRSHPHPTRSFFAFFSDQDVNRLILFCRRVVSRQETDTAEFEMKRMDDATFFAVIQASPVKRGEGSGERMRLAFMDITGRKKAEETLRRQHLELEANRAQLQELTRKLFTAQEDERKHIARELHDDYCQRVTALILEAKMLTQASQRNASDLMPRLTAMSRKLSGILSDFRALSHELLPRNLEETSLAVSVQRLIKEFSGKAGFQITFFEQAVPRTIQDDIKTTMFRLLQESLCNIVKHAKANHVSVTLAGTAQGGVELVVVDDGVGFDSAEAWDRPKGIGLIGMRERLRLLGGTLKVISRPGQGTTVLFAIPCSLRSMDAK
jgi:PAS domain S-box-containing protein